MGLLNLFRKYKPSNSIEAQNKENSNQALKIRPDLKTMLKSTLAKTQKHGGDPFYDYRNAKMLPEKYEYGMNCLFDSLLEMDSAKVFFVQKVYEEIRKEPKTYRIEQDISVTNLQGIPVLFAISSSQDFSDEQEMAIKRVRDKFIDNFFSNLSSFMSAFDEAYGKAKTSDKDRFCFVRIQFKKFKEYSDKLSNSMIFCKSRDNAYYEFLTSPRIRDGYAYDIGGRRIKLSELSTGDIFAIISKSEKEKYFGDEKELSQEEANAIKVVWEYHDGKPVYREGQKSFILEDGNNIRVIENGKDEKYL